MQEKKAFKSKMISELIVEGMKEMKALDIMVLDLRKINNAVTDYFVICSGTSGTQINSISESVEKIVFETTKNYPWKKEGKINKEWILIDYVDVIIHIFKKEKREFFALEEFWGDSVITKVI